MNKTDEIPSGAIKAIVNYREILGKLDNSKMDNSKINITCEYNKDIVKKIHEKISYKFNEESVIRDTEQGTFDMLCDAPFISFGGQDLYPNTYLKAAKVIEGFATHQVFTNGNKRLAVGAMMQYLDSKGIEFVMGQEDVLDFVMKVANNQIGDPNKNVVIKDIEIPHHLFKIANIIHNHSIELNKSKNLHLVGSSKNFNYEDLDNFLEDDLDNGEYDLQGI